MNLVLILLVVALLYALYVLAGGDLSSLVSPGTYSGGGDPISQVVGSLRSFGQGLSDMFSGMLR